MQIQLDSQSFSLLNSPTLAHNFAQIAAANGSDNTGVISEGSLMEGSEASSQQFSPITVASSVVGGCIFSALILFVVLLGVGLGVCYKRRQSRSGSEEALSEFICNYLALEIWD